MSNAHLSAGSQDVPINNGKLRLYSMRFCPYAQRVHLVLYAKNVDHDVVNINLYKKPEWYLEKFPKGLVPALVIENGENLCESLIVSDYLDERYPENPLYPKDPLKKAKDRIVIETFGKVTSLLDKIYFKAKLDSALLTPLFNDMDFFEQQLAYRKTKYFSGDKPGMIDYMIWPWCERLEIIPLLLGDEQFKVPRDRFQRLLDWCKIMLDDEAVKKYFATPEQHHKFCVLYRSGSPEYDNI